MARTKLGVKASEAKAREKVEKEQQKTKAKEEKERAKAEKERVKAEKERLKAEKDAELAQVKEQRRQLRLDVERRKLEAEKEKVEREERESRQRQQKLQGKVRHDSQMDRSRTLLSSFLGVAPAHIKPKPLDPTTPLAASAPDTTDTVTPSASTTLPSSLSDPSPPSSCPSPSSNTAEAQISPFHPFQPKPNTAMAPLYALPPATPAEVSFMDHNLGLLPHHSASSPSPSPSSPSSSLSSLPPSHPYAHRPLPLRRRPPFRWSSHPPLSRRSKLLQHHTSYRPPWVGFFPLSTTTILPSRPLAREGRVVYDVDSDEEWGEEPEGEELESGDEGGAGDEEDGGGGGGGGGGVGVGGVGGGGGLGGRGRIRADGYEEDGDFCGAGG